MLYRWIRWNVEKVMLHGVRPEEAEQVVNGAKNPYPQHRTDDRYLVRGSTSAGRFVQVVYLLGRDDIAFLIHARPMTHKEKRQWRRYRRKRGTR